MAGIVQIDFCVVSISDKAKVIRLSVCSPPLTSTGLTELSDNQQSIDMERSKSPTSGNTHTHKQTHALHCDDTVMKHELPYAACGPLTLHPSIFT